MDILPSEFEYSIDPKGEIDLSQEKMNFTIFKKRYTVWRSSQISRFLFDLDDPHFQLPDRSTLHTIGYFLDTTIDPNAGPSLNNPVTHNEKWQVYMANVLAFSDESSKPFPVEDRFIYQSGRYKAMYQRFFSQNHSVRRLLSDTAMSARQNILLMYDYTALQHAKFTGRMWQYRKFSAIFKTVLNKIVSLNDNRHHFLQIPLSGNLYSRTSFTRAFSKIDTSSLRYPNDPSYFFELELLGFAREFSRHVAMEGEYATTSMLARLDDATLDRLNLILTHEGRAVIFNMGDLKHDINNEGMFLKLYRHINLLKLQAQDVVQSEATDDDVSAGVAHDELSDAEFEAHVAERERQQQEQAQIAANQAQTTVVTTPDTTTDDTASTQTPEPSEVVPEAPPTTAQTSPAAVAQPTSSGISVPVVTHPVVKEKPQPTFQETLVPAQRTSPATFSDSVQERMQKHIETTHADSTAEVKAQAQERADKLYQAHLNVKIGGSTIGELIQDTPPQANGVTSDNLDFLHEDVPNKAVTKSRIFDFDRDYIRNIAKRDMAKVLTSFVGEGMFISSIQEEYINTRFDRTAIYKIRMVDHKGKPHSFTIKIPLPDKDGYFLINGNKSRMIKQMGNVPICKVSPTRVNLSSTFNKTLVERTKNSRNNYRVHITEYLNALRAANLVELEAGRYPIPQFQIPYEYGCIGQSFRTMTVGAYEFIFNVHHRLDHLEGVDRGNVESYEKEYGVYCGRGPDDTYLFWDMNEVVHVLNAQGQVSGNSFRLNEYLHQRFSSKVKTPKTVIEYTELKILSAVFPLSFVLGYQFGITELIKLINLTYRFIPKGQNDAMRLDEIAIPFADGKLIYSRYPLQKSLVMSGLLKFDTQDYTFAAFDSKDVYYDLLVKKRIETNFLKGIDAFFRLFIDPKTRETLIEMGEPTTVPELLLRATEMLSTSSFKPAAMMAHHRVKGYERMMGIMYNEMSRQFAAYLKQRNPNKTFSINPEAVFQKIAQDQTVQNIDTINPIHEMKQQTQLTYTGSGGRTSQSFVVEDRQYPDDAVGFMSEATPDSGKVAMTAYTSADPNIDNMYGMIKDNGEKTSTQILSVVGNLMPCVTQDDGKRANYSAIQLSHHVPCEAGEVSRVRTGYEQTVAHRSSDVFAVSAEANGVVESIDDHLKIIRIKYDDKPITPVGRLKSPVAHDDLVSRFKDHLPINILATASAVKVFIRGAIYKVTDTIFAKVEAIARVTDVRELSDPAIEKAFPNLYKKLELKSEPVYGVLFALIPGFEPGDVDIIEYGEKYTHVSGSYLKQPIKLNIRAGERIKRGDIIAYNAGFFIPDPFSKQVSWKHGVLANTAIMELSATLEDGSLISREFGKKMKMSPAHLRGVTITSNTAITAMVEVGDEVETTDALCTIEDGEFYDEEDTGENLSFLANLNRETPRARYHGVVAEISIFYACDPSALHPTIQKILKGQMKEYRARIAAEKGTRKEGNFKPPGQVPVGLKYHGVAFDQDTVLIEFMITEDIVAGQGDKICIANANKTVISDTMEYAPYTRSGTVVDLIYGTTSTFNRIVNSPFIIGMINRLMGHAEHVLTAEYLDSE